MKAKSLSLCLCMLLAASSAFAQGGAGTRGTEDDVLLGRALMRRLGPDGLARFNSRVATIEAMLRDGSAKNRVIQFFKQANPDLFIDYAQAPLGHKQLFIELRALKADEAFAASKLEPKPSCLDKDNQERTSTTSPTPGSDICVNPERVALLELAMPEAMTVRGFLGYSRDAHGDQLVFGVLMHETARQFNKDEDHRFLLGMAHEAIEQPKVVLQEAPEGGNLAFGQLVTFPSYLNYSKHVPVAYDARFGNTLTLRMTLPESVPESCFGRFRVGFNFSNGFQFGIRDLFSHSLPYDWRELTRPNKARTGTFLVDLDAVQRLQQDGGDDFKFSPVITRYKPKNGEKKCYGEPLVEVLDHQGRKVYEGRINALGDREWWNDVTLRVWSRTAP